MDKPTAAPPAPAKLQHKGFGLRVDELYQLAQAVADGKLAPETLASQIPFALVHGVCALAGEIAASRIPLVAIGLDWDFIPPNANYLMPGGKDHFVSASLAQQAAGQRIGGLRRHVLAVIGWIVLGVGVGMILGAWLYRAGVLSTY